MHDRFGVLDLRLEIDQHLAGDLAQIHRCERMALRRDSGEPEQVLNQPLHALGRCVRPLQ